MTDIAIRVENLSKLYHIGMLQQRHDTLRDALTARFRRNPKSNPIQNPIQNPKSKIQNPESDALWALRDVSFEIKRGEVVGIIGRNGAGKSTLLKVLSRITEPASGRAEIHGRVGSLLEVGTGFHPELTGRENIYLNGAILGMRRSEINRRFDEIVAFAEIERFLDTPVKRYSSGMYVRLAFAVAAHLESEILLVDEVLAVGDAEFQKKCLGKMDDVAKQGRTVLFVSHNMTAVRSLCSRAIWIQQGVLSLDATPDAVIARYMHAHDTPDLGHTVVVVKPPGLPAWIEKITLLGDDIPTTTLRMGDCLSIVIDFRAERPIRRPSIGFLLRTIDGAAVINANNYYQQSETLPAPATEGTMVCDLGILPLMADRYAFTVWFGADEVSQHHGLENILVFDVVEHDVWGKGRVPTRHFSPLWWPTEFRVGPVESPNEQEADGYPVVASV